MSEKPSSGRAPTAPGSREPSPTVSALTGFDPSRVMQDFYLSVYYEPKAERPADNVLAAIEFIRDKYVEPGSQEIRRLAQLAGWAARRLPPQWEKYVLERLPAQGDPS